MREKRPLCCSDRLSPCSPEVGAPHSPRLPLQKGALGDPWASVPSRSADALAWILQRASGCHCHLSPLLWT